MSGIGGWDYCLKKKKKEVEIIKLGKIKKILTKRTNGPKKKLKKQKNDFFSLKKNVHFDKKKKKTFMKNSFSVLSSSFTEWFYVIFEPKIFSVHLFPIF